MDLVSQHNHTNLTGHGEGSIGELAAWAHRVGMKNIAVTEHYPLSADFDPDNYISMPRSALEHYRRDVLSQRELYPDMEVVLGCELDWLGSDEDRTFAPDEFDCFDLIIGSVHFVDAWPFDDPAQRGHWDELGPDAIWRRYFEIWCEAVTSSAPFTVMAHPDLVKKFNIYPSFDPQRLYREAAEAARAGGRMVEVNTSGNYYLCKEMYPNEGLLREFNRAGIPVTIGADAHTPMHVNRDIMEGYRLMYDAGYREVTVVLPGGGRRVMPLE